jgi:hypothetical protein
VPQVIDVAQRLDTCGSLGGLPLASAETAKVDPASARVRKQDLVL